ncbi:drug resistance transporter, EmrB/QacA subfamily [Burkholderia sp. CF099]|jgi:DHA2 family multidrug resistance protein|nr:drug resistance transporter, EmrB/QacA subfamily [Burkholderia sp. CF099]
MTALATASASSDSTADLPLHGGATSTRPATPAPLTGGRLALLTVGLALGTFMEVLDTSIANVAVPTISGSLGVATSEGTWVISSYSVASAIAVPLTGWLARRVGEVRLFTLSVLLFTIASAACGFAHNFESLIAFRLLQGLVSGPMVPLSQTILMRSYPLEKRGLALGLWAMTVIVAPIFGPVMGGWITDNYTWPWIFYINLPIGLFSAACAYFLLRGRETQTTKQRIDGIGLGLLVIGVSCLQMMLDLGKDRDWFSSTFIVALAIIAVTSLAFMIVWEMTDEIRIAGLSPQMRFTSAMQVLELSSKPRHWTRYA